MRNLIFNHGGRCHPTVRGKTATLVWATGTSSPPALTLARALARTDAGRKACNTPQGIDGVTRALRLEPQDQLQGQGGQCGVHHNSSTIPQVAPIIAQTREAVLRQV